MSSTPVIAPPEAGGWMRRLVPLLVRHRRKIAITLAASLVGMGAMALTPLALRQTVDDAILERTASITLWLGVLVALGVVRLVGGYVRRWFAGRVSLDVEYDLRNAIYDHLQRLDFASHDQLETGQLVSRANSDVRLIQMVLAFLPFISANVVMLLSSLAIMLYLSPLLAIVGLFVLPGVLAVSMRMRTKVFPATWDAQQQAAKVAGVVDESVAGIRVVKAFAAESRQLDALDEAATSLFASRVRNVRIQARYVPTLQAVPMLGLVAVLFVGGTMVAQDQMTVGTFLAFNSYLVQLIMPTRMMAMIVVAAQMARASAERVLELLDSSPEVSDAPGARPLPDIEGRLAFENVTFGYMRSQPVVRDFGLSVRAGETVALVGTSGSGKSTVTMLLPRFYDPQDGRVLIDGQDVREVRLADLRRRIGVVFEDAFLFSTSIRDNIAYGNPDATDEQVRQAARAAEAEGFINALPRGLDTEVGEKGLTLSGGQRQRIALARALLTDPKILILDDATSAVDSEVEAGIHATLRRLMPGRTTIIVAHRRSTLSLADRIVVVDQGRVIDDGSHSELMERCDLYRRLLSGDDDSAEGQTAETQDAAAWVLRNGGGSQAGAAIRRSVSGIEQGALAGPPPSQMGPPTPASGGTQYASFMGAIPPDPDLLRRVEELPAATDRPQVDRSSAGRPDPELRMRDLVRPYRWLVIACVVLVGFDSLAHVAGPALIRIGIDQGATDGNLSLLHIAGLAFTLVVALDWLALRGYTLLLGRFAERLLYTMRIKVFSHLMRLGMSFFDREMAGRVMTRMTSDIESLSQFLQQGLVTLIVSLLTLIGTAIALFWMSPTLALAVLPALAVLVVLTLWFRRESDRAYLKVRDRIAAVLANFQESLSGIRVSQAFAREGHNMSDFRRTTAEHLDARLESIKLSALYFSALDFVRVLGSVAVLGYGYVLVGRGELTPGAIVAFILYLDIVFAPIQQLSQVFDLYQQARAALVRLRELLSSEPSTPEPDRPIRLDAVDGDVRLERVGFRYTEDAPWALREVDLHVRPGEALALVGETGAGKSTIMKLIARFYDPGEGRVVIDGHDLVTLSTASYRRHFGIVPQEPFLFAGTVRDNIAVGRPDATEEEVVRAAMRVGAHDFISALPDGYGTMMLERGVSLSAGERQLIALARAALADPRILLLDEATSQLDLSTEARVQRAMGVLSEGRTTILIAHRLPTARRADRIAVVDQGQIVEVGTHDDLLAMNGRYARLWRNWEDADQGEIATPNGPRSTSGVRQAGSIPG